jgi:hypothetical protein
VAAASAVSTDPGLGAAPVLRTEYEFTLPFGYVDQRGTLHRQGVMRLSTAQDEVDSLDDPRVQARHGYWPILLLSRVLVSLGEFRPVPPAVVEGLFSGDFAYLQDLYIRINDFGANIVETRCPACGDRFALDLAAGS